MLLTFALPLLLSLAPDARAACEAPVEISQLGMLLTDAETAFKNMDDGYAAASGKVMAALPCVADVIPREMAARIHREVGVLMLQSKKPERAKLAFAAAASLETWFKFDEGHAAAALYTESSGMDPGTPAMLPPPASGSVRIDGDISLSRPTAIPALFQVVAPSGQVLQTAYLWPEDAAPEYEVASAANGGQKGGGGGGGGLRRVGVVGSVLSAGLLGAGAALWVTGAADYGADICDETLSPNPHYYGQWCNDSAVPRLGAGRVLTIAGGIGLIGSGVVVMVSPAGVGVSGTF